MTYTAEASRQKAANAASAIVALRRVVPGVAEQQADEDEAVLDPLVRPQQFDQRVHAMSGK